MTATELKIVVVADESAPCDPRVRELMEELRGYTVRGPWPWIQRIEARFTDYDVTFTIATDVPDRDQPEELRRVVFSSAVSPLFYVPVGTMIRKVLREVLLHELDESIYARGERVFDPHLKPFEWKPLDVPEIPFPEPYGTT